MTKNKNIEQIEAKALNDILKMFEDINVGCWVDQGTLLGIVRDDKFLPLDWDHDFDLGIWWDDFLKNKKEIIGGLNSLGWKVCQFSNVSLIMRNIENDCRKVSIAHHHRIDGTAEKYYTQVAEKRGLISKTIYSGMAYFFEFVLLLGKYKNIRMNLKYSIHDVIFLAIAAIINVLGLNDFILKLAMHFRSNIVVREEMLKVQCPPRFFEALDKFKFKEYSYLIPVSHEEYLEFKYGSTWRTPKKEWNYLEDDGAVIK